MDDRLKNNKVLEEMADKYGKNIGQVILRWQLDTGCIPVFMSKKPERVKSNFNIFDFKLTPEDIEYISSLNQNYKIFLESWGCLGF